MTTSATNASSASATRRVIGSFTAARSLRARAASWRGLRRRPAALPAGRRTRRARTFPAKRSNRSDSNSRRTSAVVTDGRYSIAPRRPRRSSPARKRKRTARSKSPACSATAAARSSSAGSSGLAASASTPAAVRARTRSARRTAQRMIERDQSDSDHGPHPDRNRAEDVAEPTADRFEPLADPLEGAAERARCGILLVTPIAEDLARLFARGIGVDVDERSHAVNTPSVCGWSSCAVIIWTSKPSARMRRSK